MIGSGKDYRADKCDVKVSFADALREDVWTMIGWRPETESEYRSFKRRNFEVLNGSGIYFTGRELLQRYGTEVRRREDGLHWVKMMEKEILRLREECSENLILGIADARFPNEIIMLRDLTRFGIEVEFIHTNYKSEAYKVDGSHESEKLAVGCLQFWGDNDAFQNYIKNL